MEAGEREEKIVPVTPEQAREVYSKIYLAVFATLVSISVVLLAPVMIEAGFSTAFTIIAVVAVGSLFILLFLMELAWEPLGVWIGAAISTIAATWMVMNLYLGR